MVMFVAMLALLACQLRPSSAEKVQWACLPNPPSFQPVDWMNEPIRVFVNDTLLLGGASIYPAAAAAAAKSLQSCPTLCDSIDGSPPGSPIPGILQARTLEWVAISFFHVKVKSESEVTQSCPTLQIHKKRNNLAKVDKVIKRNFTKTETQKN